MTIGKLTIKRGTFYPEPHWELRWQTAHCNRGYHGYFWDCVKLLIKDIKENGI